MINYVPVSSYKAYLRITDDEKIDTKTIAELTIGFDKYIDDVIKQTAHEEFIKVYNRIYKFGEHVESSFQIGFKGMLLHMFNKNKSDFIDAYELDYLVKELKRERE